MFLLVASLLLALLFLLLLGLLLGISQVFLGHLGRLRGCSAHDLSGARATLLEVLHVFNGYGGAALCGVAGIACEGVTFVGSLKGGDMDVEIVDVNIFKNIMYRAVV